MKKSLGYLLASLLVLFVAMPAFAQIEWSGNVSAGIEKLDYGTTTGVNDDLQFTAAQVNLDLKAEIAEGVTAVVEFRNPQTTVLERSMRLELANLIPNATLMVGRVVFPMGKEADTESETGNLMNNSMIDNSALHGADITGAQTDYGMALKTAMGAVNCLLALTNGNAGASSDNNSDKAIMLRLDGNVPALPGLSLAGSYLTNDAAGKNETNKTTNLVLDAVYTLNALKVGVTYGDAEKKEKAVGAAKETKTEKDCLGIEVSYAVNNALSVAARQSSVEVKENGKDKYEIEKLQLGVNYQLAENTLFKLEYVDNSCKEKPTDLKTSADYDGIKAAVAVAF